MSALSTYVANGLANALIRQEAFTMPSSVWLAAHIGDPGGTGDNEVTGANYARVELPAANWAAAVNGGCIYTLAVSFPIAGGSWGQVTYLTLWDSASGGNYLMGGLASIPQDINSGDQYGIDANRISAGVV